jgi:23S rRNA pseudouridine1911/1915/1917 synthase
MAQFLEFSWLKDYPSLKVALGETLGHSGQLMKRYFSSKEQNQKIIAQKVYRLPLSFLNHGLVNPEYLGGQVKVLSENSSFIVLHKPPQVHCHPLGYEDKDTLLNYLGSVGKWEALAVNQDNYDRGLLYRLDYETSGVIVVAKTNQFYHHIRESFDQQVKRKFYWAIVQGDFNQEGRWTHYFKATGQRGVRQRVYDHEESATFEGTLSVLKLAFNQGLSLVLVNLKTGLRHQIRAQLAHLGFPILGDELYGGQKAQRLFLHAWRYEFKDIVEDPEAELFNLFFDLNSALQMGHDMLGRF